MVENRHVAVGVACFGVLTIGLTLFLLWRWFGHRPAIPTATSQLVTRTDSMNERLQSGIAKLHQEALFSGRREFGRRGVGGYYMIRRGISGKPLFSWSDQPELITDAVENGWSRFAFAAFTSSLSNSTSPSPMASARLLGMCAVGDLRRESEPEMSWEVCQDSADFMQKIRLNAGASNSGISVIRTALPLPGPALGKNSSFPQEAYFEITVLYCLAGEERDSIAGGNRKAREGERTKLIQDQSSDGTSNRGSSVRSIDDSKIAGKNDRVAALCVGLTAGGSLPLKLPGSYPGSIGFNTDGSVYLDGVKLVFGSEKTEWGRTEKVIGVGFEPKQKRVYFTVDSEVIHVVNSKTEEFGTPLYPTLAAQSEVSVVVNLGQSPFKYGPANSNRTPNPCFVVNSTIGNEDSKELFSMGRIDSQWLNRGRGSQVSPENHNRAALDFDEDSEADLFEIVLDSYGGKSPKPGV